MISFLRVSLSALTDRKIPWRFGTLKHTNIKIIFLVSSYPCRWLCRAVLLTSRTGMLLFTHAASTHQDDKIKMFCSWCTYLLWRFSRIGEKKKRNKHLNIHHVKGKEGGKKTTNSSTHTLSALLKGWAQQPPSSHVESRAHRWDPTFIRLEDIPCRLIIRLSRRSWLLGAIWLEEVYIVWKKG